MKKWFSVLMIVIITAIYIPGVGADIAFKDTFNNKGKTESRTWYDEEGNVICGPYGYASVIYGYASGAAKPTIERYYDENGKPCLSVFGYHKITREYGRNNVVDEEHFYDENGNACNSVDGYASAKYGFTSFGELRSAYYYDINGKKTVVTGLGYSSIACDYKGKTMVSVEFFDENKKAVDSILGYAKQINKVNKKYELLETEYFHADDSNATGPEGWHKAVYQNDTSGRHLSVTYYDNDGKAFVNEEGVSQIGFAYDAAGNEVKRLLLKDGKSVNGRHGWSYSETEYDADNRAVCTKYYDVNGRMTYRENGIAYIRRSYINDSSYTVTQYDLQDQSVPFDDGYHSLLVEEDDKGRVLRNAFLDAEGNPAVNSIGIEAVIYIRDEKGRITGAEYQTTGGGKAVSSEGYSGYRDIFDEANLTTERIYH